MEGDVKVVSTEGTAHGDKNQCVVCSLDNRKNKANSFCVICAEYLCYECTYKHKNSYVSRTHKMLDKNELPEDERMFKRIKDILACPDHPGKEVTLKCDAHEAFVCTECEATKHRDCMCVRVVEADETNSDKEKILSDLEDVYMSVQSFQAGKEKNIESLRSDEIQINEKRENYLTTLYNYLEELSSLSKQESGQRLKMEVETMAKDIERCKELNADENLKLISLVSEHRNKCQQNIIGEIIARNTDILNKSSSFKCLEKVSMTFEENSAFREIKSVGTIVTFREPMNTNSANSYSYSSVETSSDVINEDNSFEKAGKVNTKRPETNLKQFETGTDPNEGLKHSEMNKLDIATGGSEIGSMSVLSCGKLDQSNKISANYDDKNFDKFAEKSEERNKMSVERDLRAKPLKRNPGTGKHSVCDINSNDRIKKYDISYPDDYTNCSVSAISLLSDGHFVLADEANKRIKFLDKNFSKVSAFIVADKPIDLCEPDDNILTVAYDGIKAVYRYKFDEDHATLSTDGQFLTKLYPISISRCEPGLAILFSDANRGASRTNHNDQLEIQVRNFKTGEILRQFRQFLDKNFSVFELGTESRILALSSIRYLFKCIVMRNSEICCFAENGEDVLQESWYYKGYKKRTLEDATDVATDDCGQVYVCGQRSQNVHKVSISDFRESEVLFSVAPFFPTALCVDDARDLIIVGCCDTNNIYVYA